MKEYQTMLYVTNSPLIHPELRNQLVSENLFEVSGRPLNIWAPDKQQSYNDCIEVIDMLFVPNLAVVVSIPDIGHRHLDPAFRGEYIAITGICPDDNTEYRFGVRDELCFALTAVAAARSTIDQS